MMFGWIKNTNMRKGEEAVMDTVVNERKLFTVLSTASECRGEKTWDSQ